MNVKQQFTNFSKHGYAPVVAFAVVALALGASIALAAPNDDETQVVSMRRGASMITSSQGLGRNQTNTTPDTSIESTHAVTPLPTSQASNSPETTKQLLYLIEEEKLAHDVYQKMSELWGARVFGNIQRSETNHQDQLLAVMQSRAIADPRSTEVGVFTDQKLQTLYNQLIAQGSQSLNEAYKVGVAIEELDIADLKTDLATLDPKDTDVKATMENLLRGSENHLRAFSRQTQRL